MKKTLVRNSADLEQVTTAAQKEQLRGEQEQNDLIAVMSTAYGRRYIRRVVVELAGRDRSTYLNGPTGRDSDKDFLEGARNLGLQVLAEVMDACPEQWFIAEKEHHELRRMEGLEK